MAVTDLRDAEAAFRKLTSDVPDADLQAAIGHVPAAYTDYISKTLSAPPIRRFAV